MLRLVASFTLGLGMVAGPQLALAGDGEAHVDVIYEVPRAMAFRQPKDHVTDGVTLYVNKDGGTVHAGWDDSAQNSSSVAWNVGGSVKIPAWTGGRKRWKKVIGCVRDRFADFDVEVVTERPAGGDYIMIMVGGHPSLFGYGNGVGGVAPSYAGQVLPAAIGYVFSAHLRNDVDDTCIGIVHEAGHAMGLDHEYLCEDPMSYLYGCGPKRFRDQDAYCGENEPRSCGTGEDTQNSWRHLAQVVGLRGAGDRDVEPEPDAEPEDDPRDDGDEGDWEPPPDDGSDVAAPAVAIDDDEDYLAGNQWIEIVVRAADDSGIAEVELGWASDSLEMVIACGSPPEEMPVRCVRDGDTFRFQLLVGTGLRAMIARATDREGNQAVSDLRVIYLTGGDG